MPIAQLTTLVAHHLDETHDAYRDACRRFTTEVLVPNVREWEEAEYFPDEVFRQAAAAGLLGPTLDAAYGGGGGDAIHALVWTEELARCGSMGVVSGLGSLQIALPPILALGTEAQKAQFCVPVCQGEKIAALAITEPGAGSDVAGVRTRAERRGDTYVLTGSKTFITSGCRADVVTVLARTGDDPHGGLTFFVVEKGMKGFEVGRSLQKTGWRASDTAELHFDGVEVPLSHRIGEEGTGFVALMHNFEGERLALAAQGTAIAEVCLEDALAHAQQRTAFGRPIATFQVTRHKLADMLVKTAGAKSLVYAVADRMRRGLPSPVEAAMAKNHAGTVACEVSWDAVQILGGMGYMRETRVERLSRDARLIPIGGGTQEIMREIVAKGLGL